MVRRGLPAWNGLLATSLGWWTSSFDAKWRAFSPGGWRADPGGGGGSSADARLAKLLARDADRLNGCSAALDEPANALGTGDGVGDGEGDGDSDSVLLDETADLLGLESSPPKRP